MIVLKVAIQPIFFAYSSLLAVTTGAKKRLPFPENSRSASTITNRNLEAYARD